MLATDAQEEEPQRRVFERWPSEQLVRSMKFSLVIRGHLPPDKRGTTDVKQRIRRELHPQLRTLWQQHPHLSGGSKLDQNGETPITRIANDFSRCGFRFVPLVRTNSSMACWLDFHILRREEPHLLFTGSGSGDLDGRIKTLIDGLRMPQQCSEVAGQVPSQDEDPFFCLLEDDRLIYEFMVRTDRLLVPAEPDEPHRDVVAIINVNARLREDPGGLMILTNGFFS